MSEAGHDLLARAGRSLARAMFGLRVTVLGEPLPSRRERDDSQPLLLLANHPTWLDALLLASAWRREHLFVVQPDAAGRPKRVTRMIHRLAEKQPGTDLLVSTADTSDAAARRIGEHLRARQHVAAFPEMMRSAGPFANDQLDLAMFDVARDIGSAVQTRPVTLLGGFRVWPAWQRWRVPRLAPVEVIIHPPLPATAGRDELAARWREAVNAPLLDWFRRHTPRTDVSLWFFGRGLRMPRWRHGPRQPEVELGVQLGLVPREGTLRVPGQPRP
ncbi:MAG: lysophospholipid acyltransferase family protein [Planctomycetota bacterium]